MKMTRRSAIIAGMAAGLATSAKSGLAVAAENKASENQNSENKDPTLEFVFEVVATLDPPIIFGNTGVGERRIIGITGGTVTGPKFNGTVIPGGADWQVVRPDGVSEISARYTIKANDGELIYIDAPGIREASPKVINRINAGEIVPPSEYYFRTAPRLESASEKYQWVNRRLFICKGVRLPNGVEIRYYMVT